MLANLHSKIIPKLAKPTSSKVIPCHMKMHFLEEYASQWWDLIRQQMLSAQKQVYILSHAAKLTDINTKNKYRSLGNHQWSKTKKKHLVETTLCNNLAAVATN